MERDTYTPTPRHVVVKFQLGQRRLRELLEKA